MAVTFAWVYEWQNDVAATLSVGFLRARRQLSALQAAAERLARKGTIMARERESFIVCEPYGRSMKNIYVPVCIFVMSGLMGILYS